MMRYRAFAAVLTIGILLGLGGASACKRETDRTPREVPDKQEGDHKLAGLPGKPGARAEQPAATPGESPGDETLTTPELRRITAARAPDRVIYGKRRAVVEARQHLLERWKEVKSFSAKMTTSFKQEEGNKMHFEGQGTYDYMTKDGKRLIRAEQVRDVFIDNPQVKAEDGTDLDRIFTGQRLRKILDGEYVYEIDERHEGFGGVLVTKRLPGPLSIRWTGGEALFNWLESSDDLTLLPDETWGGKDCYVLEAVTLANRITSLYYFDKATGILLKVATEGKEPPISSTFELSDVKLNVNFEDDHFKFTPPEGIEVQDLTGQQP